MTDRRVDGVQCAGSRGGSVVDRQHVFGCSRDTRFEHARARKRLGWLADCWLDGRLLQNCAGLSLSRIVHVKTADRGNRVS